jgi:hypothetical protein
MLARSVLFESGIGRVGKKGSEMAMRNVKVMNIPVGVLAAWILVMGYALWAVEAAVASPKLSAKAPCSVVELAKSAPNNS